MIDKLKKIWQSWTAPKTKPDSPAQNQRSRLLASTMLAILLLSVLYAAASMLLGKVAFRLQIIFPLLLTLGGTYIAYLMSRRSTADWAPLVFSLAFTIGATISLIQTTRYTTIPLFFIIPTLFTGTFSSLLISVVSTFSNLLLLVGLLAWDGAVRQAILSSDTFIIYLLIAGFGLLLTHFRNTIEQNRQAELKNSETRLLTFLNTANDWIFMLGADGCFTFVNDKMCADTGVSANMILGRDPREFLVGDSVDTVMNALGRIIRGENIDVFTAQVQLRNGRQFWIEVRGRVLYDAQGNIEQIMHIARDISQRMEMSQAEQQQRQLAEALSETAAILNSTLALDKVLDHVLNTVHRVVPYDAANIMLIRHDKAQIVRHYGYEQAAVPVIEQLELDVETTPDLQLMIETGEPLAIADTRDFPGWVVIEGLEWIRSVAAAPIIREGECLGFLHVTGRAPGRYTAVHAASLQGFANHVANAIHNARLYENEQHRRHIAETLTQTTAVLNSTLALNDVLNRILEQLSYAISFDSASLQKREGDKLIIHAARGFPNSARLIGTIIPVGTDSPNAYVFATRGPVTFPDIPAQFNHFQQEADRYQSGAIRSWLAVPLMFDEEIIGLVTIDRNEVRPFTPEEIATATAFAQHAAIALHNADLYDQLARSNESLETAVANRTAQLQQTTQQVTAILHNSPDAILLLDYQMRPQLYNPAYADTFGYTAFENCDPFPSCLIASEDAGRFLKAVQIVLKEKQPMRLDFTAQRKDGSRFDADIALAPVQQPDAPPSLLCSIRDITALKEIERVKDDFVSNVSHELRTPIASLKLYHDLLTLNPAQSEKYIERLGREIIRLNTIVESLLQLSRLDQERIEWQLNLIDLNDLVREYATDRQPLAASRSIELTYQLTPHLPPIQGDTNLLGQVLSILLTNALNYTPSGGKVLLKTEGRVRNSQHWISVEITDTGRGVKKEELSQILKRFYRGNAGRASGEPGTGLGLAIANEIVRRHRGKIDVESAGENQGATFTVWLPAARPTQDA